MTAYGNLLYAAMLKEVHSLKMKGLPSKEEVEACFHIGVSYRDKLELAADGYIFSSIKDEIDFFKRVKPLFIGEIEFYRLVYCSELFRPIDLAEEELRDFWLKEGSRLRTFCKENLGFYRYYRSDHTYLDEQLFLRKNCNGEFLPETKLYKKSCKDSSTPDHLVGNLLALERYSRYAQEQIKNSSPGHSIG
jgi:hypothetical protein